jgi:hypothetical protein
MDPIVHPRLTEAEEFAHKDLQGIRLEIDEEKQEFLFRGMQSALASSTGRPLAGLACQGLVRGIQSLIGPREGGQQKLKLRKGQPGEG